MAQLPEFNSSIVWSGIGGKGIINKELRWLAATFQRQPPHFRLCGLLTPKLFHVRDSGIPLAQLLRSQEVYQSLTKC